MAVETLVWRLGMAEWRPLRALFGGGGTERPRPVAHAAAGPAAPRLRVASQENAPFTRKAHFLSFAHLLLGCRNLNAVRDNG
jgi:hypothetical protein